MCNLKINRPYLHLRKKTIYLLVAVTNQQADDPKKFPKMAVYSDKQGNFWSRPVSEFESNFELVPLKAENYD